MGISELVSTLYYLLLLKTDIQVIKSSLVISITRTRMSLGSKLGQSFLSFYPKKIIIVTLYLLIHLILYKLYIAIR